MRRPPPPSRLASALAALAIGGVPVLLAADVALATARGWWTTSSIPEVLYGLAGLALAGAVWLSVSARGRSFAARRWPALATLGVTLVVSFALAEAAAGWLAGDVLWFHRRAPGTRATFHPDPVVMPGVSGEAAYTANALGLRGTDWPERKAARRILCVGGSTTACLFLDDRECWPRVVQEQLAAREPVWVGDAGKSGYGSWHHVRFLEEDAILAEVDDLVVLAGINDFMRAVRGRRLVAVPGVKPLYERSRLYTLAHNAYQIRKEQRQDREEFGDGSAYVRRRQLRAAAGRSDALPELGEALGEYRANLRTMIGQARAHGVRIAFLTQPVLWTARADPESEPLLWLGDLGGGVYLTAPAMAKGMAMFNAAMRETCAAEGVTCIDLGVMDGDRRWFFDDCHFTEAGARRVGELVAAGLARS